MCRIILCGFQGVGKTTIGKRVASQLGVPFVDTDHLIEKEVGMSIRSWVRRDGEKPFRDLEKEVVKSLPNFSKGIIALGGGAVIPRESRDLLRTLGTRVCLSASKEYLCGALMAPPLYASEGVEQSYNERIRAYIDLSCIWLSVEHGNVERAIQEIWYEYE